MRRIISALFLALLSACGGAPAPPAESAAPALRKVRLALNWFPEVEHGGFYEAQRRGYYKDAGLDVEILPGGPNAPVAQRLGTGDVAFGVDNGDKVLFGRSSGAGVVALLAPIQTSPHCIMVHESAGFISLEQIRNVKLALAANVAFGAWLKAKAPLDGVEIVPYTGNIALFLKDKKFAQQGYAFSEPLIARRQGSDPRFFLLAEIGFNPYSSILVAQEKTLQSDPALVDAMVAATRKGWQAYIDSPLATNRHIHEINPEMDLDILDEGALLMRSFVLTEDAQKNGLGSMTLERWKTLVDQMTEVGLLKPGAVKPEECFRPTTPKP